MLYLYPKDYITSIGGKVSTRQKNSEKFWITPFNVFKKENKTSDLLKLDLKGNILEGANFPST